MTSSLLRRLSLSMIAVLALAISSCTADEIRNPVEPERSELLGTIIETVVETGEELIDTSLKLTNGLVYCPTTETHAGTARIGRSGGTLRVGPHTLVVPPNSLSRDITITAKAPAGDYIRIDFEPSGLTFSRSAALTMSYEHCGLTSSLLPKKIVYLGKGSSEILEVLHSIDDVLKQRVTGKLDHFSTYAVAD